MIVDRVTTSKPLFGSKLNSWTEPLSVSIICHMIFDHVIRLKHFLRSKQNRWTELFYLSQTLICHVIPRIMLRAQNSWFGLCKLVERNPGFHNRSFCQMIFDYVANLKPSIYSKKIVEKNPRTNHSLAIWSSIILRDRNFWFEVSEIVEEHSGYNHSFSRWSSMMLLDRNRWFEVTKVVE